MDQARIETVESPSRRHLFAALAAGASALITAALGGPLAALALAPLRKAKDEEAPRVDLGPLAQFAPTAEGKAGPQEVVFPVTLADGYMARRVKERVYVVADAGGASGLAVLDTTCTHLGCGVSWSAERKAFLCPCHGGVYSIEGKVIGGPPPRPLARLPFVVQAGRVTLDLTRLA
ncbi:MAG TPA: Rieske 2Fe-2S domain-containing protein [Thermoanaerobaculia bacterium]|nr:Rieske 2Fe-2S domain-containing protein [Thermoanaerobaculia bacterium]